MRLGIFGGSFDPIHYGHLRMAEVAREAMGLDRVLFVPNQVSPFKTHRTVTNGAARVAMIERAVAGNPLFAVSETEITRPGPSYSVDTVSELVGEYPNAELFFLTGTDAVRDLPGWRHPEELLRLVRFVVLTRPGVVESDVLSALPPDWWQRLVFVAMPLLEISSTDLRERVREGRSIRYLTPPAVENYIRECGLYRNEPTDAALTIS